MKIWNLKKRYLSSKKNTTKHLWWTFLFFKEILYTIQSCETEKAEAEGKKADKKGDLARAKENYEIVNKSR